MTRFLSILALAITLLVQPASPSLAASLNVEQAKSAGQVGEQPNGLLGVVQGGSALQSEVATINAKRMQDYRAIAQRNGLPVEHVQKLAGKKLIKNTKPGHYIKNSAGRWQKKP